MQHAVVSEVWKGIKRTKGTAQEGKTPFLTADLRTVMAQLPDDLLGLRDRALLLVGFAGGFRRSELSALTVEDLRDTPEGIAIRLGRSKTDQEGEGRRVALPYCHFSYIRLFLRFGAEGKVSLGIKVVYGNEVDQSKLLAGEIRAYFARRGSWRQRMGGASRRRRFVDLPGMRSEVFSST